MNQNHIWFELNNELRKKIIKNMSEERYSADGKIHDAQRLKELQTLPLWRKIQITQARIMEWYNYYEGQVYVSFSGGKDSTVLADLTSRVCKTCGYDLTLVFVDTGLEYPEIRAFVKSFADWLRTTYEINIELVILKPEMRFDEVIKKHGYPLISKEISRDVGRTQKNKGINTRNGEFTYAYKALNGLLENGSKNPFNKEKWAYLVDAPFKISNECCNIMKKKPLHKYDKESHKKPIIGTMTFESMQRKNQWLQTGCNAFDNKNPQSKPMSFWTENDVLEYINTYKIPYASVYGDIVKDENEKYKTTKLNRTGCIFCGFGCHLEKSPNRFERLKETHPKMWDYCIRPVEENGLGMGIVLDYINVPYGKEDIN